MNAHPAWIDAVPTSRSLGGLRIGAKSHSLSVQDSQGSMQEFDASFALKQVLNAKLQNCLKTPTSLNIAYKAYKEGPSGGSYAGAKSIVAQPLGSAYWNAARYPIPLERGSFDT